MHMERLKKLSVFVYANDIRIGPVQFHSTFRKFDWKSVALTVKVIVILANFRYIIDYFVVILEVSKTFFYFSSASPNKKNNWFRNDELSSSI